MREIEIIESNITFTDFEKSEYKRLNAQAKKGLRDTFEAVLEIEKRRLYRVKYNSMVEYLQNELSITKGYSYHYLDSAKTFMQLTKNSSMEEFLPQTESQTRPLTKLEPENI
jgi:hypothetical protein